MDLRRLTCFLAVAEELNFSRAAQRLHMSQPPLSQQIRLLEQEMGAQLFERSRRAVALTPAGLLLQDKARQIVELHQQAGELVRMAAETMLEQAQWLQALRALLMASGQWPFLEADAAGARVLTALRLKTSVDAAGHALFPNGERCLRPRVRLARLYPPELLAETLRIAGLCDFLLDSLRYEYPEEIVPFGQTPAEYLK